MAQASSKKSMQTNNPTSVGSDWQELREAIACFFKSRREAAGMTLERASAALPGIDVEQLAKFEAGREAIPLDLVFSLTNLYNIPPEDTLNFIHDVYGEQGRK